MNIDTWAVVVATAAGPITAVIISMWIEEKKAARQRRHWVFSTLMGLRGVTLSQDHVRALNVVQVEFHRKTKVIEAWKKFLDHLETDTSAEGWSLKHRDLLNNLLVTMANSLGINSAAIDIARGGYYPTGWAARSQSEDDVLAAKAKISKFLLSDDFDAWAVRMKDAEYRALLAQAVNQQNRQGASTASGIGL